jgi:hypothetical protein
MNYGATNIIRFEDQAGQEQLWLHAQKDQLSEVENNEDKWVGNDRRKTVDGNETNVIHKNRTETVDLDETIAVHGNRSEVRLAANSRHAKQKTARLNSSIVRWRVFIRCRRLIFYAPAALRASGPGRASGHAPPPVGGAATWRPS